MGEGVYKGSICKKMSDDVDKSLNQLDQGKQGVRDKMGSMRDKLKEISWSPASQVDQAMGDIMNQYDKMVPDLSDADEVTDMINACNFFSDNILGSPSALVQSIAGSCKDKAKDLMNSITGSLPEMDAANVYDELLNHLKSGGISVIVDNLKKALGCLDSVCGSDTSSQYQRLQNYLDDCKLNGNGEVTQDDLLEWSGITDPTKQANFKKTTDTTQGIYNDIDTKINDSVELFKAVGDLV